MPNEKFLFLRVAWMKEYKGITADDIPAGGGSYVDEGGKGHEALNFLPVRNKYYCFAKVSKNNIIRIERLGASKQAKEVESVCVVLFAKDPNRGGERVVGWYKNATVLREGKTKNFPGFKNRYYNVVAEVNEKNSKLIPVRYRSLELPLKAAGRSNIWYGNTAFIKRVKDYLANYNEKTIEEKEKLKLKANRNQRNWQPDIEKRKKIEDAAMKAVEQYYYQNGFEDVRYVHTEKKGWDLEAQYGKSKRLIEVKGLQAELGSVELTHNEYTQAKARKREFRLCVVTFALDKRKRKVVEFTYTGKSGKWKSIEGEILKTHKLVAARLYKL